MYNNNIFKKICHDQSGQEFDLGYIEEGTFIETLSLDGPKLLLTMMDPYSYLRDGLKVKELDTLSVTLTDSFASDRLDANMTFTLLKMQSNGHFIKMQLMSTSVYQAKCFVTVSKSFIQKSITEILPYYIKGLKLDIGKFPIVEDYHCLAGERPSRLLRQIAVEKGALVWADRDTLHFQRFQELWKVEPAFTYHHNKSDEQYTIAAYRQPSRTTELQEGIQKAVAAYPHSRQAKTPSPSKTTASAQSMSSTTTAREMEPCGPGRSSNACGIPRIQNGRLTRGSPGKSL